MSDRRLALETRAAQILREALAQITDDEVTLADTIEAETNLHENIHAVLRAIDEDQMMLVGIEAMIGGLQARKARLDHRIEKRRAAIQKAMEVGEIRRLVFPQATISLRAVAPGLEIISEQHIPGEYFDAQPPKLNKSRLKEDLKDGKSVIGATLDNGGQTLSIRRG